MRKMKSIIGLKKLYILFGASLIILISFDINIFDIKVNAISIETEQPDESIQQNSKEDSKSDDETQSEEKVPDEFNNLQLDQQQFHMTPFMLKHMNKYLIDERDEDSKKDDEEVAEAQNLGILEDQPEKPNNQENISQMNQNENTQENQIQEKQDESNNEMQTQAQDQQESDEKENEVNDEQQQNDSDQTNTQTIEIQNQQDQSDFNNTLTDNENLSSIDVNMTQNEKIENNFETPKLDQLDQKLANDKQTEKVFVKTEQQDVEKNKDQIKMQKKDVQNDKIIIQKEDGLIILKKEEKNDLKETIELQEVEIPNVKYNISTDLSVNKMNQSNSNSQSQQLLQSKYNSLISNITLNKQKKENINQTKFQQSQTSKIQLKEQQILQVNENNKNDKIKNITSIKQLNIQQSNLSASNQTLFQQEKPFNQKLDGKNKQNASLNLTILKNNPNQTLIQKINQSISFKKLNESFPQKQNQNISLTHINSTQINSSLILSNNFTQQNSSKNLTLMQRTNQSGIIKSLIVNNLSLQVLNQSDFKENLLNLTTQNSSLLIKKDLNINHKNISNLLQQKTQVLKNISQENQKEKQTQQQIEEGVNLQRFRLLEIQKVASSLEQLREEREKSKKEFQIHAQKLDIVIDQIKELREIFEQLQIKSGISIPNAIHQKNIQQQASFLDKAQDKFQEQVFIKDGEKKLKTINQQLEKEYDRQRKIQILDQSEHIMRVDQFIKRDLSNDREQKLHQKSVEKYRDSLVKI